MDQRKPANRAPNPAGGDQWRIDPSDVGFHARRMQEANRVGPLGKLLRYAAGALALAAAVWLYWNFDRVRELRVDFSALTDLFEDATDRDAADSAGGELDTAILADTGIAGVPLPTSIGGEAPEAETAAEPPADASLAPQPAPAAPAELPSPLTEPPPVAAAPAENEAPPRAAAPAPEPELPATPERFHFGLSVITVSEADASANVLVLRDGGRRGASSITWWTTDGTATAGTDYANLGRLVERFAAGEQNRTIRIPIIGNRNVEGPETFYVHVAPNEAAAAAGEAERLEVVINDDD